MGGAKKASTVAPSRRSKRVHDREDSIIMKLPRNDRMSEHEEVTSDAPIDEESVDDKKVGSEVDATMSDHAESLDEVVPPNAPIDEESVDVKKVGSEVDEPMSDHAESKDDVVPTDAPVDENTEEKDDEVNVGESRMKSIFDPLDERFWCYKPEGEELAKSNLLCDVVGSISLPVPVFKREDIIPYQDSDFVSRLVEVGRSDIFSTGDFPVISYKLVYLAKVCDDEDVISAVFMDKDSNYLSMNEILQEEKTWYYVCKKSSLRSVRGLLEGRFDKNNHLPVGSEEMKSSYCICSSGGSCIHLTTYEGEEVFDKEWFGCDGCGLWCHAQCLVKEKRLSKAWYEQYLDLKKRYGGSIPDDHSIFSEKRSVAYCSVNCEPCE